MAFNLQAVLQLRDQNFTRGMRNANNSMRGLKSGAGEVVKQLGLITGAAGAVGLAFASVKKAMGFESQLSTIKALTGATGEQMEQMKKLALDMGAKTKYSALEAAQGIEELLKAGLTPAQVQAEGLEASLNLATAGGLELAEAAEIMSTALNAFRDDGMKASDAANILAGTANASATDVHDLRYSLSMVSAVASGMGLSFKDTNAALGVFANQGLKGSDAGTSLKTMLLNLTPATEKASKLFDKFGITVKGSGNKFFDAAGNIKSMADIAQVLQNAFKGLTNEQRQAAMKDLFGTDAIRAANVLYREGAKGVREFTAEMEKVTALEVAEEKMNNASGAVEILMGALETLQINVMTPLLPKIREGALALAAWSDSLTDEQIKEWGNNVANTGQKILDVGKFIIEHWTPISDIVLGVGAAWVTFRIAMEAATIAQWAMNVAMDANPVGLVILGIAALVGIAIVLARHWDVVKAKTVELWNKFAKTREVILFLLGPIGALIRTAVTLAKNWESTKSTWNAVWNGMKLGAENAVNGIIDKINTMIGVINKIPFVNIPEIGQVNFTGSTGRQSNPVRTIPTAAQVSKIKPVKVSSGAAKLLGANGHTSSASGHAGGLSRVPYNGYLARLHKDERVLTPEENKAYNKGAGGNVTITGNTFTVREEADITKIADKLWMKIREARELGV